MKRSCFFIMSVAVALTLTLSNSAHADKFTDTLTIFKKSEVVRPFLKGHTAMQFSRPSAKPASVLVVRTVKVKYTAAGSVPERPGCSKQPLVFQLGGQAFREIIFFKDKRAYDEFTSGSFEFDASASAVAITAGAQAKAGW